MAILKYPNFNRIGSVRSNIFQFSYMPALLLCENHDNIWILAGDGNIAQVQQCLLLGEQGQPMDVNIQDEQGYSALHAAASYNHLELVRMLVLQYGANVNITDMDGDTPLHTVDSVPVCRLLIELGANPHLRNNEEMLVCIV